MPNYAAVYKVEVYLPLDTSDAFQDAAYSGTLQVEAVQAKYQVQSGIHWN